VGRLAYHPAALPRGWPAASLDVNQSTIPFIVHYIADWLGTPKVSSVRTFASFFFLGE
jgi:hypothetical protein